MEQPFNFVHPNFPTHIYKLNKSTYGLKQAPHTWFLKLTSRLQRLGFFGSKTNTLLFFYLHPHLIYILIYVDDMLTISPDLPNVFSLICNLHSAFAIRDLGEAYYFLDIEFSSLSSGVLLSQSKYIAAFLQRTHIDGYIPLAAPYLGHITYLY